MKVLVIGAGVSGLSVARMLSEKGVIVEVVEAGNTCGGLIHCENVSGHLYHRVGGHVFNSKLPRVLDWFWSNFNRDAEFYKINRNAKILIDGTFVGYPIENFIFQLDPGVVKSVISDFFALNNTSQPDNFYDFLLSKFGKTLCEIYFFPYNEKIWANPLKSMALDFLDGKLPSPDIEQIIFDNILKKNEVAMVHSSFYYPKNGGSQFIADRLSEGLSITYDCRVRKLIPVRGGWSINGSFYEKIIYTGDVRRLSTLIETSDPNLLAPLRAVNDLLSHGTSSLLCECDKTDLTWLYLPDRNCLAHRIIYTGVLSPANNGSSSRISCVVEFSGKVSESDMIVHVASLPGNLVPIASNYQETSYVLHDSNTAEKMKNVTSALSSNNMYLLGRFAEWQYFNMDTAIDSAFDLVNSIVH